MRRIRTLTPYPTMPIPSGTERCISFWRDSNKAMYWHGQDGRYALDVDVDAHWFNRIQEANLPLDHRFFALVDVESGDLRVYLIEDMKNGEVYNWYDMAWFCTKSDINLGVLDRSLCPEETQNGRRPISQVLDAVPTKVNNTKIPVLHTK